MAMELELAFPYWKALRRKFAPESPLFASGNIERELLVKQIALDFTEDEKRELWSFMDEDGRGVYCPIVGCGAKLSCLEDFEDHYNARHTASCSVCFRCIRRLGCSAFMYVKHIVLSFRLKLHVVIPCMNALSKDVI